MLAILSAQITSTTSSLSLFWINALITSDLLPQSFRRDPVRSAGCDFPREIYPAVFAYVCRFVYLLVFHSVVIFVSDYITQVAITRQRKKRAAVKVLRISKQPSIELTRIRPVNDHELWRNVWIHTPQGPVNILPSVFLTCQNSFKTTIICDFLACKPFPALLNFIDLPRFLVLCHGIYHLSVVFSWFGHLPKGLCVHGENTCDSWDIPWLPLRSVV